MRKLEKCPENSEILRNFSINIYSKLVCLYRFYKIHCFVLFYVNLMDDELAFITTEN